MVGTRTSRRGGLTLATVMMTGSILVGSSIMRWNANRRTAEANRTPIGYSNREPPVGDRWRDTEIERRIERSLPAAVSLDRLSVGDGHAIVHGHAETLGSLANLVSSIDGLPGADEPELHRVEATEAGFAFAMTLSRRSSAGDVPLQPTDNDRRPPWAQPAFYNRLVKLIVPPQRWQAAPPVRRSEALLPPGSSAELLRQTAADRQTLAAVPVDEIRLEEIHQAAVGGVAVVRVGARTHLLREGDRLADGDVDQIRFATPRVAWMRLRRRIEATTGIPYRPVVWLLAERRPRAPAKHTARWRPGRGGGLSIGGDRSAAIEVHRLSDDSQMGGLEPPWSWQTTIESAPLLFAGLFWKMAPDALQCFADSLGEGVIDPERMLTWSAPFGTIEFRYTSRDSISRAVADELDRSAAVIESLRTQPPATAASPAKREVTDDRPPNTAGDIASSIDEVLAAENRPVRYEAAGRRDPFRDRSRVPMHVDEGGGPRPEGIAGLLIDDLEVETVFVTSHGNLAEIRTPLETFFIDKGAKLWDAEVQSIDPTGVTFRQWIDDPTSPAPFRHIVKRPDRRWARSSPAEPSADPIPRTKDLEIATSDKRAWLDAVLERDEEALHDQRTAAPATAHRDPFLPLAPRPLAPRPLLAGKHSLEPATAMAGHLGATPSVLETLGCRLLCVNRDDRIDTVLDRAGLRLTRLDQEREIVRLRPAAEVAGAHRYLADIEAAAAADLASLVGYELHGLRSLLEGPRPALAELLALVGDLNLIRGRPGAAAAAYRRAQEAFPGTAPLCGRLHDGKIYGAETFRETHLGQSLRRPRLTGYVLAWDPSSERVLERHLLAAPTLAFASEGAALVVALEQAGKVRLGPRGFEPSASPAAASSLHWNAVRNGWRLASNLMGGEGDGLPLWSAIDRPIDHELPLTLDELESAIREAAARDPTQLWNSFLLGQAFWAQGRNLEAAGLWQAFWREDAQKIPLYELLSMAGVHEIQGQTAWADRAIEQALDGFRKQVPPARHYDRFERWYAGTPILWIELRLRHRADRAHVWWRALRELSAPAAGDAFRAALWAAHFDRRGDRSRARLERSRQEQAELGAFDMVLASAWVDYALYASAAIAITILALLAALHGALARRIIWRFSSSRSRSRDRRPEAYRPRIGRYFILRSCLLLTGLLAAFFVALSLTAFAASNAGYHEAVSIRLDSEPHPAAIENRQRLDRWSLLRAWLRDGVVSSPTGTPSPLIAMVRAVGDREAWELVFGLAALLATLFAATLPAGLLLAWRPVGNAVTRWLPGAAHVRSGKRTRGLLLVGLFVYAILPISWLVVARSWAALAAPGVVSASLLLNSDESITWLLPPASDGDAFGAIQASEATARERFDRLREESFWRLLGVYPAARWFWLGVICAALVSTWAHIRRLRAIRASTSTHRLWTRSLHSVTKIDPSVSALSAPPLEHSNARSPRPESR